MFRLELRNGSAAGKVIPTMHHALEVAAMSPIIRPSCGVLPVRGAQGVLAAYASAYRQAMHVASKVERSRYDLVKAAALARQDMCK